MPELSHEWPFIVRAWPVDTSAPPVDQQYLKLGRAIDSARSLAHDQAYRSVQVLDIDSMCWAQFNMLWSVPDGYA